MTKTASFAALHFTVAFSVAWALTGSPLIGGAVALIEPTINTIVFHFHERAWKRHEQRKLRQAPGSQPRTAEGFSLAACYDWHGHGRMA